MEEKLKLTKVKKVKEAEARVELETELERINALEDAKVAEGKRVLLQHRDLLKNQIDQKRFEHAASQFNKKQEKMMARARRGAVPGDARRPNVQGQVADGARRNTEPEAAGVQS